jgi:pre-mRNA-splicing factor 18
MDFLKAEIERKKRQMEQRGVMAGPNKKYFKRGDLAEKQREEYIAKHAPNIEELKKIKEANPESSHKRVEDKKTEDELAAIPNLPKAELVRRLRERGHPILLFGETLTNACERLKQIEMDAPDATGSQASGLTNDFKEARETVDQEYMKQMLDSQGIKDEIKHKSLIDEFVTPKSFYLTTF